MGSRGCRFIEAVIGREGSLVGLDLSREMLLAARRLVERRGWRNVRLVRSDAAALPLRDGTFDGALSVLTLSVVPDWRDAILRIFAALRPGAALAFCDARPFPGRLGGALAPLLRAVYGQAAAWDPGRPIPEVMGEVFGNVEVVRSFNLGSFYVATSRRTGRPGGV